MIKLSKKNLISLAQNLNAYYFTGNKYIYENIVFYLREYVYHNVKRQQPENVTDIEAYNEYNHARNKILENTNADSQERIKELLNDITNVDYNTSEITELTYSTGAYGINGQIHALKLFKNNNLVKTFILYY